MLIVWFTVEADLCKYELFPPPLATLPVTAWGQTVSVSNVSVAYQQQALLGCSLTGYSGTSPVVISIDKVSGPASTSL